MDTKKKLAEFAENFVNTSPLRYVTEEDALSPDCIGAETFQPPIMGVASANDPLFDRLKDPAVIGDGIMLPDEWLPGAVSVISFFFPASEDAKRDNLAHRDTPSHKWMQMTSEGSKLIRAAVAAVAEHIKSLGYNAVVPTADPRFTGYDYTEANGDRQYFCRWSERHAAFITGLGTFSLTRAMITRRGMPGRFGSIITDMPIEADTRPYAEVYEYCTMCGACIARCPAGAITLEGGKNNIICSEFIGKLCADYPGRSSCGKCQVGVPCQSGIPKKG